MGFKSTVESEGRKIGRPARLLPKILGTLKPKDRAELLEMLDSEEPVNARAVRRAIIKETGIEVSTSTIHAWKRGEGR